MPLPKLKNLFVSETCLRFCAIDLQISFLALAIASKKNPKLSVKLAQSGCNLAQSVKLGVQLQNAQLSETWVIQFEHRYQCSLLSLSKFMAKQCFTLSSTGKQFKFLLYFIINYLSIAKIFIFLYANKLKINLKFTFNLSSKFKIFSYLKFF